jgi:hypothetical protein
MCRLHTEHDVIFPLLNIGLKFYDKTKINNHYVKIVFKDMLNTIGKHPNTFNLENRVQRLLSQYSFYHVWFYQGVATFV